jgi:hypothetical protein
LSGNGSSNSSCHSSNEKSLYGELRFYLGAPSGLWSIPVDQKTGLMFLLLKQLFWPGPHLILFLNSLANVGSIFGRTAIPKFPYEGNEIEHKNLRKTRNDVYFPQLKDRKSQTGRE